MVILACPELHRNLMIAVPELLFELGLERAGASVKHRPPEAFFTLVLMDGLNGTVLLYHLNDSGGSFRCFFGPALQRF